MSASDFSQGWKLPYNIVTSASPPCLASARSTTAISPAKIYRAFPSLSLTAPCESRHNRNGVTWTARDGANITRGQSAPWLSEVRKPFHISFPLPWVRCPGKRGHRGVLLQVLVGRGRRMDLHSREGPMGPGRLLHEQIYRLLHFIHTFHRNWLYSAT